LVLEQGFNCKGIRGPRAEQTPAGGKSLEGEAGLMTNKTTKGQEKIGMQSVWARNDHRRGEGTLTNAKKKRTKAARQVKEVGRDRNQK